MFTVTLFAVVVTHSITKTIKKTFNFTLKNSKLILKFGTDCIYIYVHDPPKNNDSYIYVKFNVFLLNHQTDWPIDFFFISFFFKKSGLIVSFKHVIHNEIDVERISDFVLWILSEYNGNFMGANSQDYNLELNT